MKKRIVFIINRLGIGGVERAFVALCNSLVLTFDIQVLLIDKSNAVLLNNLAEDVDVLSVDPKVLKYMKCDKDSRKNLNVGENLYKLFIRILSKTKYKTKYEKYITSEFKSINCDYAVSYTGYPGIWDTIAEQIQAKEKFVYIHNNPYALGIDKINNISAYYERFHKIICVSKDIRNKMYIISPELREKLYVSYNLLDTNIIDLMSREENPFQNDNKHHIITVARIENRSKRFDRVVEIVKMLIKKGHKDFIWHIIGDGEDKEMVSEWITSSKLQEHLIIEGFQENPYKYIKNADLFVLTSDYEGLPVTLMEVRYLKIPAITTDFSCAKEIIENGSTGYICTTGVEEVAQKICSILYDAGTKERIRSFLNADDYGLEGDFDYNCLY